ncbi:MAG: ATP phosphoribosyltransferase regulatory subunit [Gammaproteobacteria bacterium]|nr:ATP phosphoribosyltransferase regulatory subunit [Gammaproteobacteria bacterium]
MSKDRWLLPEGIEESLPDESAWLEIYRRKLVDMFSTWGYELVIPPMIEYLDSLLIGPSDDLDLQTFKLTDQLTGRMMGVRADMTSQVARIDAHMLKREAPTRFCYLGTVLHTRPSGRDLTRSPLQVGAELYGHSGLDSDVEVICLMLEALSMVGIDDVLLDLGHVGIFTNLVNKAGLNELQQKQLQALLQQKAQPEYEKFLATCALSDDRNKVFLSLMDLSGDTGVIAEAKQLLKDIDPEVIEYIDYVAKLSSRVVMRYPNIQLHYDFAALSGYRYQNGAVFAAYVSGQGGEIARGGRYDMIGKVFGRSRPATGFSVDLKALAKISPKTNAAVFGIYAPNDDDSALQDKIKQLRAQGERVICALSNQQGNEKDVGCNRVLVKQEQQWVVKDV